MPAIIKGPTLFSDHDLQRLSETNPGWQFERSDDGALLVSPTARPGGSKSGEAFAQLYAYAKRAGGKAYDAQTGFKTPGGGVVSPDAAWLSDVAVRAHAGDDGYWQIMPDIVIEVVSKTDEWPVVVTKIDKYFDDGATYAIAIDPKSRETYERGTCPHDLELDIAAIVEG